MFEQLVPLVTYCALMAVTPGPNNVMLATSGANFGYRRTLPHLLGIVTGVLLLTLLACLGLGAVFTRFPQLHDVLRVVGALYMVYLAWKLAGASISDAAGSSRPLTFTEGAIFQVVNPKSWVRALTIATVFMPPQLGPVTGALLISFVGMLTGFPCISVWTLFGVAIRGYLQSPARLKTFNLVMSVSLLALAVSLMLPRA
jgi:threonine/homoserine/homoserine lactone efflux protein